MRGAMGDRIAWAWTVAAALWVFVAAPAVGRAQTLPPATSPFVELLDRSFEELSSNRLDNGVQVILDPSDRALVSVAIAVSVGRRDQPPGWGGLAHLAEHLMFRTEGPMRTWFGALEDRGAMGVNGFTSADRTVFVATLPADRLHELLWLEARRFASVVERVDARTLDEERSIVLRERSVRASASLIAPESVYRELYGTDHPYMRALTEPEGDLAAIDVPTMRRFLQGAYSPDRITVAISGGVDVAPTLELIQQTFGQLRPSIAPELRATVDPPRLDRSRELRIEAPVPHDAVLLIWPSPAYGTPDDAALDLAAHILEQRLTTHLGARGLYQGPRRRGRHRRGRTLPSGADALRLAPPPRFRGDPGRPRHASQDP